MKVGDIVRSVKGLVFTPPLPEIGVITAVLEDYIHNDCVYVTVLWSDGSMIQCNEYQVEVINESR